MAVIDRTTPEGRKFYAELKKLAELESYAGFQGGVETCLLYTSDAADEL